MENRRTMARVFPDLFAQHRVRPVGDYAVHLLRALRASVPSVSEPSIVVLTPGVHNSTYFEHSLLARQMGVELVEGRDLFCRDNTVYIRTTEGERQVHVIYRRIDDEFLDPLQFRPDSVLGVAGLVNAARAGNVVVANGIGNGVGDDKLIYTYVPDMVRYYLGEKPLLPNVDTFRWRTRAVGSPSRSCSSRPCRPRSRIGWRRVTSTCGPSRSTTARVFSSCPAA